ncbi:TIGR03808 family TAT-translocated repetitive protein [Stappia sp. F7233]|uniref:TIGR03808 family TAT-translocated repetitive protein n=1 Tax=Stappia albiluteola TaxID=2758565 RepID=A0A839AGV2_9HYPH|nr:TIGR03808 family TAT-translocated repetitive protein [Stappia albiluteola]MBA5779090.1 TIGR03808 family TAT-translocated repetitive protein [Stappia albiluteola]
MDLARRGLLVGAATVAANGAVHAATRVADLRGTIDGAEFGLRPGAADDQSAVMQKAIDTAAERGRALFLPGGRYPVANLRLPQGSRLVGLPGQTHFVYQGGGGHLLFSEGAENIGIEGIHFDGANKSLGEYTPGLLHFSHVKGLTLEDCTITGSMKSGIALDRCSGRLTRNSVSGAAEAGIRSIEAAGLSITDNTVSDCANAGILVYRWNEGEDGSIVSGNRVERIAARAGGTGQNGNGINIFRAAGVIVSGNRVADCTFSAIRSNAGSNVTIQGNSCLRSGETAIYSEFTFQGAVIADNLVDGATMGISIANAREGGRLAVCSGNLIRNLSTVAPYPQEVQGFGIGIAAESDTTITGNVVENAPLFGLMLGWGPYLRDVIASQNILRDCGTGIAVSVVDGAGPALITDNIIRNAKSGAVVGYRWRDAATGDLTEGQADRWPHLDIRGNLVRP